MKDFYSLALTGLATGIGVAVGELIVKSVIKKGEENHGSI